MLIGLCIRDTHWEISYFQVCEVTDKVVFRRCLDIEAIFIGGEKLKVLRTQLQIPNYSSK